MLDFLYSYQGEILAFFAGILATHYVPKAFDFLLGRNLERFKLQLLQTQKADRVAELFAYFPLFESGHVPTKEDGLRINQLLFELAIYLPSDLVCDLSRTVCLAENRPYFKDCLVRIREYIIFGKPGFIKKLLHKWTRHGDGLIGQNISHMMLPTNAAHPARVIQDLRTAPRIKKLG